jgi:Glucodextranase, domain B/PASTA domain
MPGLRIAATVTALLALAIAPAAAQATVSSSQITTWTSSEPGTPANNSYLISFDNDNTTLSVSGTAVGTGSVDIACYSGAASAVTKLASSIAVHNGTFTTGAVPLKPIAGSACRLRAVPVSGEAGNDNSDFAGPQVAVSEAAIPVSAIAGGPNANLAYNFYVNDVTLSGWAAWGAAGANPLKGQVGCGGPFVAPMDPDFDIGNFAIDCVGSLMGDDLGAFGGRSEVQVDGRNAYDAASAQALFGATSPNPASQNLTGFPRTMTDHVVWDPSTGLLSSQADESWVECNGQNEEVQVFATCSSFVPSGVELERDTTTSDAGRVVTMTDTWSSTDGRPHVVDLLDDDFVGLESESNGARGYYFPGQTSFSEYGPGTDLPGPSSGPGSILVRTNVTAPDGIPSEAAGAITFGAAPSAFQFVSNNEFEEHNVLVVPAGGSASLTYIYSVGYSVADVAALALQAQDRFDPPSVVIGPPAGGTTVATPSTTLSGVASAGSGISSLAVDGQTIPVAANGTWTAQVPLGPGTNMLTAVATDRAGANAQAQVAVVYNPPQSPPPPPPAVKCKVPKTKGMKLGAAEKALRRAHCRVGKIKHEKSRRVRSGRVASTTPRAGRTRKGGSKIELFVSRGH